MCNERAMRGNDMRKGFLLNFMVILSTILYFTCTPVFAAAAKTAAIPKIQTECNVVLIQLEIMPKATKSTPKLSDKIKLTDFTLYLNNAMSVETEKPTNKSSTKVKYITYAEAEEFILKALGYGKEIEGKSSKEIISKADELGLNTELSVTATKHITRGEASVLILNSLTVPFATIE